MHIWDTRFSLELRSESLGSKRVWFLYKSRTQSQDSAKSLLQMPRSRPHWSRYIKIGIRAGRIPPSIVSELSLAAAMLCGSWLWETTLSFTFFFSSLRLLDISYFCPVSHFDLTWIYVRRPTIPYFQVKLVGRREGEKAKVKRETAAEICTSASGALWRHTSLTCKDRLQDLLWRKQWSNKLTTFVCKQFHRSSYYAS